MYQAANRPTSLHDAESDQTLHDNTSDPAMAEVERIEAQPQEPDEWIVTSSHDEQWDHVDSGEDTSSVSRLAVEGLRVVPIDGDRAHGHVHSEVAQQEDSL